MNKQDKKSNAEKRSAFQQPEASLKVTPQQSKTANALAPQTSKAATVAAPQAPKASPAVSPQPARADVRSLSREFILPNHEDIAKRAYQIYVEQGRPQGQSEQNWNQAEQEQRNRNSAAHPSK